MSRSPLQEAANKGNIAEVEKLLKDKKTKINDKDDRGLSALHLGK